ncbi:MAG: hypothetical protein OEY52_10115 [Gammaproteobacteria bacterium]|nr:hypothetical protein [Gammaproteobacteria bacterium]
MWRFNFKLMSIIILCGLLISPVMSPTTLANPLRAPDPATNQLFFACSEGLVQVYKMVKTYRSDMEPHLYRQVSSLLMAAEIDGQFKSFPSCVNKLERAYFLLIQANYNPIKQDKSIESRQVQKQNRKFNKFTH